MDTAQDAQFAAEFHADVDVEKIAEVYAEAFLNAAEEQGVSIEDAVSEFGSFIDVLNSQPKLETILASAMLSTEDKVALLQKAVFEKASPLFWNFLKIVAKRGRLDILRPIFTESQDLSNRRRKRIPVTVTTAAEMDPQTFETLAEKLRNVLGGDPVVRGVVDPDVLGGVIVRVDDTIYDASILTQLKNVRQQMIDRSAHEIQCRRNSFRNSEGN